MKAVLLLALLSGPGDDLRDVVTLESGETVRGRVVQRFDPDELLLVRGGSSEEIPWSEVAATDTVPQRLATFLADRTPGLDAADSFALVGRALELELPEMARLQAYHVLTLDPGHAGAHAHLGHREHRGRWQWSWGGKHRDRDDWDEHLRDWGHPLELASEHYRLRTDTGLANAVAVLMDLERAYLAWFEELGAELAPREVLEELRVEVYGDLERFPKLSSAGLPYFELGGAGAAPGQPPSLGPRPDQVVTFQDAREARPARLFDMASQQLLYASLLEAGPHGSSSGDVYHRQAAWVEVGLGHWFGEQFRGQPGHASPGTPALDAATAHLASTRLRSGPLKNRREELTNLTGLGYQRFHELTGARPVYWAKSRALVAWLLDPATTLGATARPGRDAVVAYVRSVYGTPTAHSTAVLDESLSVPVDELRDPWLAWLAGF